MKCQKCGFELPDTAKFCRSCGTKQEQLTAPVATPQAPPIPVLSDVVQKSTAAKASLPRAPAPVPITATKARTTTYVVVGLVIVAVVSGVGYWGWKQRVSANALAKQVAAQEASDTQKLDGCRKLLAAGMYNGILETMCSFNKGVKLALNDTYSKLGCRVIVSQKEVDDLALEILKDTRERFGELGKVAFCNGNIEAYDDLAR